MVEMSVGMIWQVGLDEMIWGAEGATILKTLCCFWVGCPL